MKVFAALNGAFLTFLFLYAFLYPHSVVMYGTILSVSASVGWLSGKVVEKLTPKPPTLTKETSSPGGDDIALQS